MKLYSYYRSSASYRVRIALNYKKIAYDIIPVHLLNEGGEQFKPEYQIINPNNTVPTLVDGTTRITQSLAAIEYLEATYPSLALLPDNPKAQAEVRSLALTIACDVHPLNNLRILKYLKNELHISEVAKNAWYVHWLQLGFKAIETELQARQSSQFCYGTALTLADVCLIPQVYNAHRFEVDMTAYPLINEVYQHCLALAPVYQASPEQQPDYPKAPAEKS